VCVLHPIPHLSLTPSLSLPLLLRFDSLPKLPFLCFSVTLFLCFLVSFSLRCLDSRLLIVMKVEQVAAKRRSAARKPHRWITAGGKHGKKGTSRGNLVRQHPRVNQSGPVLARSTPNPPPNQNLGVIQFTIFQKTGVNLGLNS
jgi:hypothetical protein